MQIYNDSIDKDKCTVFSSLDLSAVFDIVDQRRFKNRLGTLGIRGTALKRFTSYLHKISYNVCIRDSLTTEHRYQQHNLMYHSYADDTQIYVHCKNDLNSVHAAILRLHHHHHRVIKLVSSISSTHFFSISLKLLRSSNEQGRARRVHCIMCAVFSVARSHSHVTSPSKYPHFCIFSLLHVNPVRSRFRHLHVVHGLSYPLARLSLRLTVTMCGVVCNLRNHSLHRMILGENSAGFTLRKKQFLDFRLF